MIIGWKCNNCSYSPCYLKETDYNKACNIQEKCNHYRGKLGDIMLECITVEGDAEEIFKQLSNDNEKLKTTLKTILKVVDE